MATPEQQLLQQGIADYGDAVNAIDAFRKTFQKKYRLVVEDNLKIYSEALGIDLSKGELEDFHWSEGGEYSIGVRFKYKSTNISYAEFSHSFWWSRDERGVETEIGMYVWSRRRNIELLKSALRQKRIQFDGGEDGKTVWVFHPITAADTGQIEKKLEKIMKEWISLWRKCGGIKALGEKP